MHPRNLDRNTAAIVDAIKDLEFTLIKVDEHLQQVTREISDVGKAIINRTE